MKRRFLSAIIAILACMSTPLLADGGRLIVRVKGGQSVLQADCVQVGCTVAETIDGSIATLFLVTTPAGSNVNGVLSLLLSATGVVDAEIDTIATVQGTAIPPALTDQKPISYYGSTVPHGYVNQPATSIIRLADTQQAYPNATGSGVVVAVIDTGVDPNHPVLKPVLLPGYDFTRNQNGADETKDITLKSAPDTQGVPAQWVQGNGTGELSQSTAAVVDQSTAAVVDGNPQYADFGHGTMVSGIVHLIAPTAKILPLKAFSSNGTGYNSDILRAIYYAIGMKANVFSMSFNLAAYSQELAYALQLATTDGTISVAAAGNSGKDTLVYPAALSDVMGVASTTNGDQLSTFSNYGSQLVWLAAPGEGVVTTYPFSTYAAAWGTSFSTPQAAGVAAVLLSMNPLCDQYSAASALAHAKPMTSAEGNGRLDMFQAVQAWSQATGAH